MPNGIWQMIVDTTSSIILRHTFCIVELIIDISKLKNSFITHINYTNHNKILILVKHPNLMLSCPCLSSYCPLLSDCSSRIYRLSD